MRRHAAFLAVILLGPVAGCLATPGAAPEPRGDASALPEGVALEGADVVARNETAILLRWTGALGASAQEAALRLPGTTPLDVSAVLRSATDAGVGLQVWDEYGARRCRDADGARTPPRVRDVELACATGEVAPLGWERSWRVRVAQDAPTTSTAAFEVDVEVRSAPGAPVEAVAPAGLDRIEPFEAVADDGIALRGHVYLPRGPGPFATILHFSPYWNGNAATRTDAQAIDAGGRETIRTSTHGSLGKFLDAGFAVALVNLRGTGDSGGCHTWFDPQRDGADAAAVIGALAEAAWSDGNVGMVGISWHGASQYAALATRPPALKAIAPSSAILDPWLLWTRYGAPIQTDVTGRNPFDFGQAGVFYAAQTLDNSGYLAPVQGSPSMPRDLSGEKLRCPEYAEHLAAVEQLGVTGDDAPFWEARRTARLIQGSGVPMLVTNGLRSPAEGHVLQVEGLWPLLPEGSVMVLGQWGHEFPETGGFDAYQRMALDWFDHHLRGNGPRPPPVVHYQDTARAWHASESWPPAGRTVPLFLSAGRLVPDASAVETSEQAFQSMKDETPEPTRCPFWATYATPPLAEDVHLAGVLVANLTLASSAPDGNLALFVWAADDVVSCGDDADASYVTRALTDLRHRGHLRQGKDFPVGAAEPVSLRSHPFAATIPAGKRLVVAIGGDAPRELADKPILPRIAVRTGAGTDAAIQLPVVEGALRFVA